MLFSVARMNSSSNGFYDNRAFSRGTSVSSRKSILPEAGQGPEDNDDDIIEVDDESFRSDLERDSIHSSMSYHPSAPPLSIEDGRRMSHEERYAQLQRQSSQSERRSQQRRLPILDTSQIQLRLEEEERNRRRQSRRLSRPPNPPPPLPPPCVERNKPEPKIYNLFGVIDTAKLKSICGLETDRKNQYAFSGPVLDTIPETVAGTETVEIDAGARSNLEMVQQQENRPASNKRNPYKTSQALFYGSIASYVAGILLLMSFCSPYWLQSWEDTQSPFKNMGLWEFCFYKFRHPDYQFDHLFHGCHALYGHEYRLIREKLLPGWLMVVQLFVTLALISSFLGQAVIVCLLLRAPLEWILRFEWHFCGIALVCKGVTAVLLFLSICIFGGECWSRDWLLYPNYNYVSWSYAFAVFSCLGHLISTIFMYVDCQQAKERKEKNKALIMQMHGFSSTASSYPLGGSGYI